MVKENKWFPEQKPKNVKIGGEGFKVVPLLAKERDEIIEKHVSYDSDTGETSSSNMKILRELIAKIIVDVPESLKAEFKKVNDREWTGAEEDYGLLYPGVEDAIADALKAEIGSLAGDKKDF